MKEATLIFPHQLFQNNPAISKNKEIFLIEESIFFNEFKYHKFKLLLHRASMRHFFDYLKKQNYDVRYINFYKNWINVLKLENIQKLHIIDVCDFKLEKKIKSLSLPLTWYKNPSFLTENEEFRDFYKEKKHYSQTSFYIYQRKKYNILLDKFNKPLEGKWTFDKLNREKLPENITTPKLPPIEKNEYIKEAKQYIENHFSKNYGTFNNFIYPISHTEIERWFENFLEKKLEFFGTYEDAISKNDSFLFHSCISFALNIGLITPKEILDKTLDYAKKSNIPLNSLEGFIRQIIGWREFIRGMYLLRGKLLFNSNFFNHQNPLPKTLYEGKTEILPVDNMIKKVLNTGYLNHIERLMIMGNFCLLCQIHPKEIYKWFMELFIDAYDWVMLPNIFGMSQFADGGSMVTKPYLSSSNYILKMSNFKKDHWAETFNSLYWNFIYKNQEFFKQNPRLRVMTTYLNKIEKDKIEYHIKIAEKYIEKLLKH